MSTFVTNTSPSKEKDISKFFSQLQEKFPNYMIVMSDDEYDSSSLKLEFVENHSKEDYLKLYTKFPCFYSIDFSHIVTAYIPKKLIYEYGIDVDTFVDYIKTKYKL